MSLWAVDRSTLTSAVAFATASRIIRFFERGTQRERSFARQVPFPRMAHVQEDALLARITVNPEIFSGKPIVRGRRLAVEHVLGMLAAGDSIDDLLREYPWLERDDIQACLVYAKRLVCHERVEPAVESPGE